MKRNMGSIVVSFFVRIAFCRLFLSLSVSNYLFLYISACCWMRAASLK